MKKNTKENPHPILCILCCRPKPLQNHLELTCCRTNLCFHCITTWIITKTKSLYYQENPQIPCVNSTCKEKIEAEALSPKLPKNYQTKISSSLLRVYINKTNDIVKCPRKGCSYAGIIDPDISCISKL